MADFLALTPMTIPSHLQGQTSGVAIRPLTTEEQTAIEDHYFESSGNRLHINADTMAVFVSSVFLKGTSLFEFRVALEFAFALLTQSGFQPFTVCASFTGSACHSTNLIAEMTFDESTFRSELTGQAACEWIAAVMTARQKIKDRMHVTADRFVCFVRAENNSDAFLDLCISLESLIGEKTELAFRFSICLARVEGSTQMAKISEILHVLYSLRSDIVHGTDPTKSHNKLMPDSGLLQSSAKTILIRYVLFLAEDSQDAWKKHLKTSLLT